MSVPATGAVIVLTTELLFVYVYCLVDDAIKAGVLAFVVVCVTVLR